MSVEKCWIFSLPWQYDCFLPAQTAAAWWVWSLCKVCAPPSCPLPHQQGCCRREEVRRLTIWTVWEDVTTTHLMTFPSVVRLRLMAVPSLSLSASEPEDLWRSLPAKSTRLMLDCLVMLSLEKIWEEATPIQTGTAWRNVKIVLQSRYWIMIQLMVLCQNTDELY